MNIVCIPYHDWRKIEMEGYRTRDAHIIEHFSKNNNVEKLLIVNRPITLTEIILKRKKLSINGKIVFKGKQFKLYEIKPKLYVLDFISADIIKPLIQKKKWFIHSYGKVALKNAFSKCQDFLGIKESVLLSQNIFSVDFVANVSARLKAFDAWDNFVLFPDNASIANELKGSYSRFVSATNFWTTNAGKNKIYFKEHYQIKECHLIKNGVDIERFQKKYSLPSDMNNIPGPIIGFGGKITHLFNFDYFNYCTEKNLDKNFVIVGQVLDSSVFSKIKKATNVFYLGDKHYDEYPAYVTNFDTGIVPYVTNHLEHGADSIKVYEYLAAGLKVVGTAAAGMDQLQKYLSIAHTKEEFAHLVNIAPDSPNIKFQLPPFYTWSYKASQFIDLFNEHFK